MLALRARPHGCCATRATFVHDPVRVDYKLKIEGLREFVRRELGSSTSRQRPAQPKLQSAAASKTHGGNRSRPRSAKVSVCCIRRVPWTFRGT